MAKKTINVGLIGLGTIGTGVVRFIEENSKIIEEKQGITIKIKTLVEKDLSKKKPESVQNMGDDINLIMNDPEIDIVIELIGGYHPAKEFILKAIENKKHVVTANKAVISEFGKEIFQKAQQSKVNIHFEAAVGGGIPIIKLLQHDLASNDITKVMGILNGTTNYILTKMSEGLSYKEALLQAKEKGFAEANPSFDVEGKDSAQKLAILASIIYNTNIHPKEIYTEGITDIERVDINVAKELGYAIKLLAIAKKDGERLELRVHPTLIKKNHPLASINNEFNSIYIEGNFCQEQMFVGKGAGQRATASAVIADVIAIAKKIINKTVGDINLFQNMPREIINTDDIETEGYIRIMSKNVPGVFGKETTLIGRHGINIVDIRQRGEESSGNLIPDIITIESTRYETITKAIKELGKLDCVEGKPFFLRIE
jgi:homoserine dehydrogenase